MYSARSSGEACTIMYTEIANSSIAPSGTPFVLIARHALASSPARPLRLVRPRLNRRRIRYFKLLPHRRKYRRCFCANPRSDGRGGADRHRNLSLLRTLAYSCFWFQN